MTACPDAGRVERIQWFETNLPNFDTSNIFFAQDKTKIDFDVIFEDCPRNIEAVGGERAVVFTHPYNIDHEVANHRVSNWEDIYTWVTTHCEPKTTRRKNNGK